MLERELGRLVPELSSVRGENERLRASVAQLEQSQMQSRHSLTSETQLLQVTTQL